MTQLPSPPPPKPPCAKPANATEWMLIFKPTDTSEASSLAENKISRYFALKQNVTYWTAKQVSGAAGNVYFPLDKSFLWPEGKEAVSRNAQALCLDKKHLLQEQLGSCNNNFSLGRNQADTLKTAKWMWGEGKDLFPLFSLDSGLGLRFPAKKTFLKYTVTVDFLLTVTMSFK